ncbi:sialic acid-binding Ig-like lectin 10 isoform X2 [Puntigrus tetrazona]|uniref:sialic acid-binding Ig-like lectin 10 isoform X2 n=1 Tax=Puntigrus tetrazona TaxID=1606681 RepID=UPI001C89C3FC|nr:sialic acid-binding Ig-like lectin 10 isoform X2 [Puntigrus tetrazona]
MFSLFCLVFLLMISVNCSQRWEVQYTDMMKCALKGSTVHLSASYKHPNHLNVKDEFWIVNPVKDAEPVNLLNHPNYRGRVQFFRTDGLFFLNLSGVKHEDEGIYCIRILADVDKERFHGYPGIELKVTDLRVEIPEEVVEGQSPVLVCKSTCKLSDKADFTWYKDGEELSEGMNLNHLWLRSVNSEDTGNYSCAARDQKHLPSAALTLSVRYPPRSVRVSVSPSAEVVEGDSVTLICSSDSNPPALNFSWFKENQSSAVGSEQSLIISSFNSSHSGLYYCVQKTALYAAAGVGAGIVCICIITVVIKLIRKRVTPSGSGRSKPLESPEDAYMSLEPKSRCSEYDTLDNMKRSCENTEHSEDQEAIYYNSNY